MTFPSSRLLLTTLLCGITSAASAQAPASAWGIGIGAASRQLPYRDAERKDTGLPLLFFENQHLRFAGLGAEFKLLRQGFGDSQEVTGGLKIRYEDNGYEADDSPALRGMEERKAAFWGGPVAAWRNPVANVSVEWLSDLSRKSKGQKFIVQLDQRFAWGSFALTPRLQGQWLDKKYVDYYFGVRAAEALADRAAYVGSAAWTAELGVRADYALTREHLLFVDLGTTRLPDEIKRSPIVGRSSIGRVAAGYMFRF